MDPLSGTAVAASPAGPASFNDDSQPSQSFTDYWQRGKEDENARKITFVQGNGPKGFTGQRTIDPTASSSSNTLTSPTGDNVENAGTTAAVTKAQARRAQVRKAQIQHRQRKADYTKHLEVDTARLRELIERTQQDSYALATENETMRQMLIAKLGYLPAEATLSRSQSASAAASGTGTATSSTPADSNVMAWEASTTQQTTPSKPSRSSNSSPPVLTPVYSVSVMVSEVMGTPALEVKRASSPKQATPKVVSKALLMKESAQSNMAVGGGGSYGYQQTSGMDTIQPTTTEAFIGSLSEEQTDHAINFILGLEHICWDHWDSSYFTHQNYDEMGCMHGHAMMASSIALQTAPVEVFNQLDAVGEFLRSNPHQHQDRSLHAHNDDFDTVPSFIAPEQHAVRPTSVSTSSGASTMSPPSSIKTSDTAVTSMTVTPAPVEAYAAAPVIPLIQENNISWPATGLSLQTLHALASTLSPPETELAPVQAWFEILRSHGTAAVLNHELMGQVLAEFSGVVRCLHFGAVIERDAFDSIITRVLGAAQWA